MALGGGGGGGGMSAQAALATSAAEARRRRGLVQLPRWLLAPSRYQRHWVSYGAGSIAAAAAAHFVYRHELSLSTEWRLRCQSWEQSARCDVTGMQAQLSGQQP